jgi:hypothetical protein
MQQQQHKQVRNKTVNVYIQINNLGSCKGVIILGYSKYINY